METGIGYRFHPTEDELINHYLKHKVLGYDDEVSDIPQVNVLDYEPWELPLTANADQVWYFFCERNYKYKNSQRAKRTTRCGFWKVTGKDQKIKDIAIKKRLVYHQGRPPGVRTSWVMHEYHPTFNFRIKRDFVVCKLKKRPDDEDEDEDVPQPSTTMASASGNNPTEEDSQLQAHVASFQGYNEMDYSLNSAMQWGSYYYTN
ncbi:hypothetical protein JCGZ_14164 [Jatropha curcas]|uniref:NAC transcription factor 068 n=1 Tax=Jatropha curcas TaxID=180498 RepID=R4NFZ8_JATCU|nr:NAC domain-containing protein 69 [Jatropha curcas]AGL39724.1 NAC transcription factor 068 [Jatropha curcas]KDP28393.1 hypothetical protein JCGZ_14164 [Jatropha curcas]